MYLKMNYNSNYIKSSITKKYTENFSIFPDFCLFIRFQSLLLRFQYLKCLQNSLKCHAFNETRA